VPVFPLAALLALAALTEVLQFLAEDRGPSLQDVATNAGGVLTGALLALLWAVARRRQMPKS
jgi:VanZ family protein